MTEELLMHYDADFGMEARIGRFHNIYGPCGTWKGGREKAPAAFCRKGITSEKEFEMWGNGKQTRSFCYIDDAVSGSGGGGRRRSSNTSKPSTLTPTLALTLTRWRVFCG